MTSEYQIQLDNKQNILFEVLDNGDTILNDLNLVEPKFETIGLLSGAFTVDSTGNIDTSGNINILGKQLRLSN